MEKLKIGLATLVGALLVVGIVATGAPDDTASFSVPTADATKKGGGSGGTGGCDGKGTTAGCFTCNSTAYCRFVCVGHNECSVQYKPSRSCSASGFCASGGPFTPTGFSSIF